MHGQKDKRREGKREHGMSGRMERYMIVEQERGSETENSERGWMEGCTDRKTKEGKDREEN